MATVKDIKDASQRKQALVEIIYGKINDLLGGGVTGQLFCMEFPARPLNHHLYEYDTDSRSSVIAKPFSVADAEFRLTDDLFNVAPIVQGPSGKKLSITFLQLINNYVPRLKELHDFIIDKNSIRQWLLSTVEDTIDGAPFKGTRMELCKQLYASYLTAKASWDQEKNTRYETDKAKSDLDHFADWLSREALVQDQGLNNLFNDAVVRGYYHEVLTFLGFLNVCSSAEALETTKQNARNSSRRSLDESMEVLPVQLQPNDWFRAMRPNLSPKDLTMASDLVIEQYKAKLAELSSLKSYLVQLKSGTVDKDAVETAARQLEDGKRRFQEAESGLIKSYGDGAVSLFKVYLNATTGGALSAVKEVKKPETQEDPIAKKLGLLNDTVNVMLKTYKDQQDYLDGAERLAQLRTRLADTSAHDYQAEVTRTTQRMEDLQADIRYLESLAGGVLSTTARPAELSLLPDSGNDPVGEGMFMDVVISETESVEATSAASTAQASNSAWKVGAWFCSAGGQSSSAMASSNVESAALSNEFKIGFRVAKVTIDRGGWFNPTIFDMSSSFQRIAQGVRASPSNSDEQLSKAAILAAVNAEAAHPGSLADLLRSKDKIPYMLPAYPVGFVIAKDITIRIKSTDSNHSITTALQENSSSSGGGFLCFSASRAASSKSTSESAYHGEHAGYYYVRIPGPQILGWFLQLTPNDNATKYEALEDASVMQLQKSIASALTQTEMDEHPPHTLEHRSAPVTPAAGP